jgi:hypothetical protein
MTKQVKVNGFAKDISSKLPMDNNTTKSSVRYFLNKFIDDCEYNIKQKHKQLADIHAQAQEVMSGNIVDEHEHADSGKVRIRSGSSTEVVGAPHYDEDRLIKLQRDAEWNEFQIGIAEDMKQMLTETLDAVIPEEVKPKAAEGALSYFQKRA